MLISVQDVLGVGRKLSQKDGAEKPHPGNSQQRAKDRCQGVGQLQIAPRLAEGVPIDL